VWQRCILGIAKRYNTNYTPQLTSQWLLVVGKDRTSSQWRYNWGTWEWSSWIITVSYSRYTWIDDTFGPINDGSGYPIFYFVYRSWTSTTPYYAD